MDAKKVDKRKKIGNVRINGVEYMNFTITEINMGYDLGYDMFLNGTYGKRKDKAYIFVENEVCTEMVLSYAKKYPDSSTWEEVKKIRRQRVKPWK